MLVLKRVVKDSAAQDLLRRTVQACAARGYRNGVMLPGALHAEFVDAARGEGGSQGSEYFLTVPYALADHLGRLKWYVAHELSHVWQAYSGVEGSLRHDRMFYKAFKAMCATSSIHYELEYLPSSESRHGIPRKLRKR